MISRTVYTLSVPGFGRRAVPAHADVEAALAKRNPELESALASAHLADLNVAAARIGYLPELELNYAYGIDAPQFAVNAPDGSRNLGYSASATLNIPIWDWFTTHDKVRQSEISRDAARVTLTNTQRKNWIAELEEFYSGGSSRARPAGQLEPKRGDGNGELAPDEAELFGW